MNYSVYKFTLDLQVTQSQVSIPVTFGDTGRQLYITLTDGGSPYLLKEGSRAVLSARKADGNTLFNNCIIDLKNMAIMYTFTEQTANCEGITQCEILIYGSNGEVVGSPRFIMIVDRRVISDDDVASISEKTELDLILARAYDCEDAEKERVTAENSRVEAEGNRTDAETARKNAENLRIEAENTRAEAEKTRTTFIPSVSEDGVISWSNDKGLENPAPILIKPVKEIDYFTESDKNEIISGVLNALPYAKGVEF